MNIAWIGTGVMGSSMAKNLAENGYNVYVAADACASRTDNDKQIGLEQMRKLGANIISTEMVLFGFIESSKVPNFKDLSNLLK